MAKWNLHDWKIELDELCMTYWGNTLADFSEAELMHLWNMCLSPQDAFQVLAKKYDMPTELPVLAELEA